MASRKRAHQKTPDVLGEVLSKPEASGAQTSDTPERHQDSMLVNQKDGNQVYHKDSITEKQEDGEMSYHPNAEKVKATFYLSQEAVDALDEAWFRLRRLTKTDKGRVSKSAIVDIAVQTTLEELETKGSESQLARKMLSQ